MHLMPGVLVVAAYTFLAEPFVNAIHYPIFLAWAIALLIAAPACAILAHGGLA